MPIRENFWQRPGWLFCLLLPLFHFASVKLTFFCAVTPENAVVVWLPNAVLLAALLRFRGQRALLLASLTFTSDVLANLSVFHWYEAVLFSVVNVLEVGVTYRLMRQARVSPALQRLQDLVRFILAGPVVGALISGLLAALVLKFVSGAATSYPTLARLWWFGDGLGLLIYTPLLLAFTHSDYTRQRLTPWDRVALLMTAVVVIGVQLAHGGEIDGVSVTPTLLLPLVAAIAFRFGTRLTTLVVALISLSTAMVMNHGGQPFGSVPIHLEVVRAQEFILTLCVIGIGFAVLLNELRARERELESRVRERTRELEQSNARLAAMSSTDGLTGIANRRHFDEALASAWRQAGQRGEPLTLALLDVDMFKQYNDSYGHQAGDDALRAVAAELRRHCRRDTDFVARYGGEEFALIAPGTDRARAQSMADAICRSVAALNIAHRQSPGGVLTASIGVAVLAPRGQDDMAGLLRGADMALYRAKQQGRNRVVLEEAAA